MHHNEGEIIVENLPDIVRKALYENDGTWISFGIIWEWAKKQEWWDKFTDLHYHCCRVDLDLIDPIRFPELVVQFLKERKP